MVRMLGFYSSMPFSQGQSWRTTTWHIPFEQTFSGGLAAMPKPGKLTSKRWPWCKRVHNVASSKCGYGNCLKYSRIDVDFPFPRPTTFVKVGQFLRRKL